MLYDEQNQKNFQCSEVLSLIQLGGSQWLFAGIYRVRGVREVEWGAETKYTEERSGPIYKYDTEEIEGLSHLTGRVVVDFQKSFRAVCLVGKVHIDQLMVGEIRREKLTIGDFPGYNSVMLNNWMHKTIIQENNPSWKAALSNVSGVYLITDTTSGMLYVGSAYGEGGVWQRWLDYAETGHGGNVELRELLKEKGDAHAEHFQFSLLETLDLQMSDKAVIDRENHWKQVLHTREHGLNKN